LACLSRSSYTKRKALNRLHLVYKRSISLTNLASGVQNWRFVYKYALFDLQTGISPYKLAPRITTQQFSLYPCAFLYQSTSLRVFYTCIILLSTILLPFIHKSINLTCLHLPAVPPEGVSQHFSKRSVRGICRYLPEIFSRNKLQEADLPSSSF
jgi:hypothetical protein